jgi:uncharacterized protein (UPF0333 family)
VRPSAPLAQENSGEKRVWRPGRIRLRFHGAVSAPLISSIWPGPVWRQEAEPARGIRKEKEKENISRKFEISSSARLIFYLIFSAFWPFAKNHFLILFCFLLTMSNPRAQNSLEYMLLLGALLVIGLVIVSIIALSGGNSSDSRLAASQAHWAREAHPLQVRGASLNYTKASGAANLSLVIHNTASSDLTIRQIILIPGTFGPVYYQNGTSAGTTGSLSVLFAPDEERILILPATMPWGSSPPQTSEFSLTFKYDSPLGPGVENGSTSLIVATNAR